MLVLACIGTALFTATMLVSQEKILRMETVPIYFTLDDYLGFTTEADALRFGVLRPGDSGQRYIVFNNSNTYPVSITIRFAGEAGKYVRAEPQEFTLEPREGRKLDFDLKTPAYLPYGNYTGRAHITFKEAR